MPGTLHQGLLTVFRHDPWLAFDLLGVPRPVRGTPIDRRAELDHATEQLDKVRSRYPDLVLVWRPFDSLVEARKRPTAAVLVGALHGRRGNLEAARMAMAACDGLPDRRRRIYLATIIAAVRRPLRDILIGEMNVEEPYPLWEIERESGTYEVGMEAGIEQGRRQTLIEMILALLEVRGVSVDAEAEARIRSCESLATLQRWAQAAREVAGATALFG